jgi:starch synthase (maltosyl-transferring)
VSVDAAALGLDPSAAFRVRDELSGATYTWRHGGNFVRLDPSHEPAHVFAIG